MTKIYSTQNQVDINNLFLFNAASHLKTIAYLIKKSDFDQTDCQIIYFSERDRAVPEALILLAAELGLTISESLFVGTQPLAKTFRNLRHISQLMKQFCQEHPCSNVWTPYASNHYGYLAKLYVKAGASVSYYEEGLGTYRRHDDMFFSLRTETGWVAEVRSGLRNAYHTGLKVTLFGKLLWLVVREVRGYARFTASLWRWFQERMIYSSIGQRRLVPIVIREEANSYFRPFANFDKAVVSFPDKLDPILFNVSNVVELETDYLLGKMVASSAISDVPRGCVLFISQGYGINQRYYHCVAKCISDKGVSHVVLKFHPRETRAQRIRLQNALTNQGVEFFVFESDEVTSEQLAIGCEASKVLGIASSSLPYLKKIDPTLEVETIGNALLTELKGELGPQMTERLRIDIEMVVNLFGAQEQCSVIA